MSIPPGYRVQKVYLIHCEHCNEEITRAQAGDDLENRARVDEYIREHHKIFHERGTRP